MRGAWQETNSLQIALPQLKERDELPLSLRVNFSRRTGNRAPRRGGCDRHAAS